MPQLRILFCSFHCQYDTASGAATCARDLTGLLDAAGWECAIISGPRLDLDRETSLHEFLRRQELKFHGGQIPGVCGPISVPNITSESLAVVLDRKTALDASPSSQEAGQFLQLLGQRTSSWRPDVVLTYGGGDLSRVIISYFKNQKIPVVFWLRNHAYYDRRLFSQVDGIVVPSSFTAELYWRRLAIKCSMIHPPMDWERLHCREREEKYVTFINPQPRKGVHLFAAIVRAMAQRPDIPFLVVEGMAGAEALEQAGLDLSKMRNIKLMRHTPDPRHFYGVTKLLLVPSTDEEPSSRCAAEAQISGIPVIASDRGGLAETVGEGGIILAVPRGFLPEGDHSNAVDVTPWVEAIIRFWDDSSLYETCSRAASQLAETRRPERLGSLYDRYFRSIIEKARRG